MTTHKPVLLEEAVEQLVIQENGIYVDGTFGRGGHSAAILARLSHQGRLLAFDRDWQAIDSPAAQTLSQDTRFHLCHSDFVHVKQHLAKTQLEGKIDGLLLDLGISSPQVDESERGFSFMHDGPLDMRMDTTHGMTAAQWLAQVDEKTLADVLFHYGEERFSRYIARRIVESRKAAPLQTTRQLAKLIEESLPIKEKNKHPATRSFQAIRIHINDELFQLQTLLEHALQMLRTHGRLVVISFHSIEDRMVKQFMKQHAKAKQSVGRMPIKDSDLVICNQLTLIGKAIKPTPQEIAHNPRARSAVLRVAERV